MNYFKAVKSDFYCTFFAGCVNSINVWSNETMPFGNTRWAGQIRTNQYKKEEKIF